MNKRRLLKLADLLEVDAKNENGIKFDLRDWGMSESGKPEVSCGTVACAVGLAAVSGIFKSDGLGYAVSGDGSLNLRFQHYRGWTAVRLFFDIEGDEASFLFSDKGYSEIVGAEAEIIVAKRIRDFVAGKVAP